MACKKIYLNIRHLFFWEIWKKANNLWQFVIVTYPEGKDTFLLSVGSLNFQAIMGPNSQVFKTELFSLKTPIHCSQTGNMDYFRFWKGISRQIGPSFFAHCNVFATLQETITNCPAGLLNNYNSLCSKSVWIFLEALSLTSFSSTDKIIGLAKFSNFWKEIGNI